MPLFWNISKTFFAAPPPHFSPRSEVRVQLQCVSRSRNSLSCLEPLEQSGCFRAEECGMTAANKGTTSRSQRSTSLWFISAPQIHLINRLCHRTKNMSPSVILNQVIMTFIGQRNPAEDHWLRPRKTIIVYVKYLDILIHPENKMPHAETFFFTFLTLPHQDNQQQNVCPVLKTPVRFVVNIT